MSAIPVVHLETLLEPIECPLQAEADRDIQDLLEMVGKHRLIYLDSFMEAYLD